MSNRPARAGSDDLWLDATSGRAGRDMLGRGGRSRGKAPPSKVSSVSFRRTSRRSDGTLELEAGSSAEDSGPASGAGDALRSGAFQPKEEFSTGPGKAAGAAGQEIAFVGVNKAIENRATINLMLMRWEDAPRTVLVVEKSDKHMREGGIDGARLSNRAVVALEGLCRHCHEALHLNVVVEARLRRELPHLAFLRSCDEDSDEEEAETERRAAPRSAAERCTASTADGPRAAAAPAAPVPPRRTPPPRGSGREGGGAAGRELQARRDMQRRLSAVDFCIALGHDGATVATAALFDGAVPPILPLALNAEGILARLSYTDAGPALAKVVDGGFHIGMRARLCCTLHKAKTRTTRTLYALNDVVLDRGPSPFLTSVECLCNDRHVTLVQGDGLILATPTGSTAYSQAAGGSMVHPSVPCILFTPLNPHSLSFRPIVLPVSVRVTLRLTPTARSPAWVSFDGRQRQPLESGDELVISIARWPVPVISLAGATDDWLEGCNAFLSGQVTQYVARLRLRPAL